MSSVKKWSKKFIKKFEIEEILKSVKLNPIYVSRPPVSWEIDCWTKYAQENPGVDIKSKITNHEERKKIEIKFLSLKGLEFEDNSAIANIDGHRISFPIEDYLLAEIFTQTNAFEESTVNLLKKLLKKGMTVINIGANVGYLTLIAAREIGENGKIYAIEPKKSNADYLQKNVNDNKYTNVEVIQKGVSNKNEQTTLILGPSGAWNFIPHKDHTNFPQEQITTITIDEFMKKHSEKMDVVIMDAEGSEPYILEGMEKTIINNPEMIIITELNPHALKELKRDATYFLDQIKKLGFLIYLIDEALGKTYPTNRDEILKKFPVGSFTNLLLTKQPISL